MHDMKDFVPSEPRNNSIEDRRTRKRRPTSQLAILSVIDGLMAGENFDGTCRDPVGDELSVLIKGQLRTGQLVKVAVDKDGRFGPAELAEVLRCRLLTTGRFEVVVQFRREAPKPQIEDPRPAGIRKKLHRPVRPSISI